MIAEAGALDRYREPILTAELQCVVLPWITPSDRKAAVIRTAGDRYGRAADGKTIHSWTRLAMVGGSNVDKSVSGLGALCVNKMAGLSAGLIRQRGLAVVEMDLLQLCGEGRWCVGHRLALAALVLPLTSLFRLRAETG